MTENPIKDLQHAAMELHQAGNMLNHLMRDIVTRLQATGMALYFPSDDGNGEMNVIAYMAALVEDWQYASERYVALRADFNKALQEFIHA